MSTFFKPQCVYIFICALLIGCGGSGPNGDEYNPTSYVPDEILVNDYQYFGRREFGKSITSSNTGVTYGYELYLPPEYDLELDRAFPVLYITDAQFDVSFQAKMLDYTSLTPVIMVGITEGPAGRRGTDYTLPGATTYFRFFTQEFIPAVEAEYRIIAEDRTFEGASAGGVASLVMMSLDVENPPIFKNHFVFDPWQPSAVNGLLSVRENLGVPLNKTLFITSASGGFENSVRPFTQSLRERNIDGLTIHERVYDVGHTDITWASLFSALNAVYDTE
ncbi:MAG: enterochelin esterase-like enzyme [Flavobacteriales bacterium]|jgi:enterochelin esterase-like enzyme